MGCLFLVTTIEDAWQFVSWIMTTCVFFQLTTFTLWNPKWFAVLRHSIMVPPENVVFSGLAILSFANGWAAWRLWVCSDWDADPVPLLLYFIMILVTDAFFPVLMLAPATVFLPMIVAIAALGMSVVFTVFAFFDDMWAGIVGVVNILVAVVFIAMGVQIWMNGNVYINYKNNDENGTLVDKNQRTYDQQRYKEYSNTSSSTPADVLSTSSPDGVVPDGSRIGAFRPYYD